MSDLEQPMDINTQMMLDGNAVAGALQALLGVEMTSTSLDLCSLRQYEHDGGVAGVHPIAGNGATLSDL